MIAGEPVSTSRPRKNRPLKKGDACGNTLQRQKTVQMRRVVRGSLLACLMVMLIITGRYVYQRAGEWTEIQQITVVGLDRISRDEIITQLALPPHSSLFSFDGDIFTARLQSHPWIRSVAFDRVFPHSLVVQIAERQPVALVGSSHESYLLDIEGYVLPGRKGQKEAPLPIVEGIPSNFLVQRQTEGHGGAKLGIHIAGLLSQRFTGRPRIDVSQPHMTIVDLPKVRFQFGRDADDQWQRFLVLYPTVKTEIEGRLQEVDLRFPQKVILRKRTL